MFGLNLEQRSLTYRFLTNILLTVLLEVSMSTTELSFRKKNIPLPTSTKEEEQPSVQMCLDTAIEKVLISNQLNSKSQTCRKILNLFSMVGTEFKEIRGSVHSLREAQVRYEEALDSLRLHITQLLEATSWLDTSD